MKICLINPGKFNALQPPLGLAYIASYLRKYDEDKHDIKIIDENAGDVAENEISRFKPDIVGISATTPQICRAMEIAEFVKENIQEIPVVIGGVHPTVLPEQTLKDGKFDFSVVGEGEISFFELVQSLKNGFKVNDLKKIKGLCFKNNGSIVINEKRPLIENLDIVPFPARDLLNMDYYLNSLTIIGNDLKKATQIMTSRGCPYACVFCASFAVNKRRFRMHSAEYVINEIEDLINKYNFETLCFQDDTFIVDKERAKKICQLIIEKGINEKITWTVQMRANLLSTKDLDFLNLLNKAGCVQAAFGFESGSPRILSFLKKNTVTVEQNHQAIELCKKAGLGVFGNFMIGTIGETADDIKMTENFILHHNKNIDSMGVYLTVVYPGTELWNICKKKGMLKNIRWEEYVLDDFSSFKEPPIFCDTIPKDKLLKLHRDLVSLSIERYSLKLKVKKILKSPVKIMTLALPYMFYKIKNIVSK